MPPKISFMNPPIFKGTNFEDALDWIERYEATGQYNRWENEQLASNFGMYLDGAARKWFLCNTATLPNHWPPRAVAAVLGINQPDTPGLRSRFLSELVTELRALIKKLLFVTLQVQTASMNMPYRYHIFKILAKAK